MMTQADKPETSPRAAVARTTESHPRPSAVEALERGHMRKAASDHTQRAIWRSVCALLGVLLVLALALAWGSQ